MESDNEKERIRNLEIIGTNLISKKQLTTNNWKLNGQINFTQVPTYNNYPLWPFPDPPSYYTQPTFLLGNETVATTNFVYNQAESQKDISEIEMPLFLDNFVTKAFPSYNHIKSKDLACSYDGKYCTSIENSIAITSDFGKNFAVVKKFDAVSLNAIAMSSSGKYQLIGASESSDTSLSLLTSNDYGQTWINVSTVTQGASFSDVAMSASGQYQMAVTQGNGVYYASGTINGEIYFSQDYGNSWIVLPNSTIIVSSPPNNYYSKVAISEDGQYYAVLITTPEEKNIIYTSISVPTDFQTDFISLESAEIDFGSVYFENGCVGFQFVSDNTLVYANFSAAIILSSPNGLGPFSFPGTKNYIQNYVDGGIGSFSCSYDRSIAIVVGKEENVFISSDLFNSFSQIEVTDPLASTVSFQGNSIYVSSSDGIYLINSCQNELEQPLVTSSNTLNNVTMSSCGNVQFLFDSTTGILYKSIDKGKNFKIVNTVLGGYSLVESIGNNIILTSSLLLFSWDGGITWSNDVYFNSIPQTSGTIDSLYSSDDTFYMVRDGIIYSSKDYGQNWKTLISAPPIKSFSVSRNGKTLALIYGSTDRYVLISNTEGLTWYTPTFSEVVTISANPNISVSGNGKVITLLAGSKIYSSNNYGEYFFYLDDNVNNLKQVQLSETGQYQNAISTYIYQSSDYGKSWTSDININGEAQNSANYIFVKSSNNGVCTIINDSNIISSSNYGIDFFNTNYYLLPNFDYIYSCQSKDGKNITLIAQEGYIVISNDYGQTWRYKDLLIYNWDTDKFVFAGEQITAGAESYYQCAMSTDGRIQVTVNNGVRVSNDYGNSWYQNQLGFGGINSVAISGNGCLITVVANNGNVFTSKDYGVTFSYSTALPGGDYYNSVAGTNNFEHQVALGTGTFICLSEDFGSTWITNTISIDDSPQTYKNWVCVRISASGNMMIANTSDGTICISEDFGLNWYTVSSTSNSSSISDFSGNIISTEVSYDGKTIYALLQVGDDRGIYYSTNKGKNWARIQSITQTANNQISISTFSGKLAMLGTETCNIINGVLYSRKVIAKFDVDNKITIGFSGDGRIRTGHSGRTKSLYVSYDWGNNWFERGALYSDVSKICLSQSGQYQIISHQSGAYISSDYGQTFSEILINEAIFPSSCAISEKGTFLVLVGFGFLAYSFNYGNSWTIRHLSFVCTDVCISSNVINDSILVLIASSASVKRLIFSNNSSYPYILGLPQDIIFAEETFGFSSPVSNDISCSSDGDYILTTTNPGLAFRYNKCLNLWETICELPIAQWTSVFVSKTGRHQIAVSTDKGVWFSQDFGETWNVKIFESINFTYDTISSSLNCQSVALTGTSGTVIFWNYLDNTCCESVEIDIVVLGGG